MAKADYDRGLEIRKEVLGEEYVERALKNVTDLDREFQQLMTDVCWGQTWGRPGLTLKQRSLINLCLLAALNRPQEFATHFRGALNNGCTLDELRETFIQIAIYAGFPAGNEAFRIGKQVLAELQASQKT